MSYFRTHHPIDTDVDISSVAFWSQDFQTRERSFARLRASAPVSWHPPLATPGLARKYREAGFWAVTRVAEVALVSRRPDLFSSQVGRVNLRPAPFSVQPTMLVLDPPAHSVHRRIVSAAFTARAVAALEPTIARHARQIVLRAGVQQEFDFVSAIAAKLPLRMIATLLGLPTSEHDGFVTAAGAYADAGVPRQLADGVGQREFFAPQAEYLRELCRAFSAFRRAHPGDDIMTRLVQAEIGGRRLSEDEIFATVLLLIVAGHVTTKQATTLSVLALDRHREQRRWLLEDFDSRFDSAFDELMRYTCPLLAFARTATRDVELAGRPITKGDKVALFYCSANRDESVFEDPGRLDLARPANDHVAFGGGGVHFCLGSTLARAQIKALLREILTRLPDLRLGAPVLGFSDFTHTVEALPAQAGRVGSHRSGP
jgi:cytochrome P450